jgi:hypothetical protein
MGFRSNRFLLRAHNPTFTSTTIANWYRKPACRACLGVRRRAKSRWCSGCARPNRRCEPSTRPVGPLRPMGDGPREMMVRNLRCHPKSKCILRSSTATAGGADGQPASGIAPLVASGFSCTAMGQCVVVSGARTPPLRGAGGGLPSLPESRASCPRSSGPVRWLFAIAEDLPGGSSPADERCAGEGQKHRRGQCRAHVQRQCVVLAAMRLVRGRSSHEPRALTFCPAGVLDMDNGSSHRGERSMRRLQSRYATSKCPWARCMPVG